MHIFRKGHRVKVQPETPLLINNEYQLNLYINETDCTLYMGTYEKDEVVTISIEADSEKLKTSGTFSMFWICRLLQML